MNSLYPMNIQLSLALECPDDYLLLSIHHERSCTDIAGGAAAASRSIEGARDGKDRAAMTTAEITRSMHITYTPIGIIHSPFTGISNMPIQPAGAGKTRGNLELFPEYAAGLRDLDGFSHLILIYHFHRAGEGTLTVTPFLDTARRGVFATRAPTRPNPIGLSTVKLIAVDGPVITVEQIDILDGTPLLDLKPYIPEFDTVATTKHGWIEEARKRARSQRSDARFCNE